MKQPLTMIYKFRMISGDEKAFLREYEIDSSSNFLDFHNLLQENLGFDVLQLASFFLTDEHWHKGLELTVLDMDNDAGLAAIPMESVKLSDLLKTKKERLLYVFDIFSDRCFFIELSDIIEPTVDEKYPRCIASVGIPPEQLKIDVVSDTELFTNNDFEDIINDIGNIEDDINFEDDSYIDEDDY